MIKSMTGFGKAQQEIGKKSVSVQIKSLNSKQLDFHLRAPSLYRDRELDIRSMVASSIERGKVEVSIQIESELEDSGMEINKALFKNYHGQLQDLSEELGEKSDLLPIISRFPEILRSKKEELSDAEWRGLSELINKTIDQLNEFRSKEGEALEADITKRIELIRTYLNDIEGKEENRIELVRSRIDKNLNSFVEREKINMDRFEQEMIYYLEKIDITEEKTRLRSHCDYFISTISEEKSVGKKLGFIAQEIGREINTIGSKANHAGIQKLVVQMKDELEKIKEQLLNVL